MPVERDEIKPDWIELRREIIQRRKLPVKAGPDSSILLKSSDNWGWIMLPPRGERSFASDAVRDDVLAELTRE